MRGTSLTRQVLAGSSAVLVGVLAGSIAVGVTEAQVQAVQRHNQHLVAAVQADDRVLNRFVDEETAFRGYLLTGNPGFLAPYTQAQATLPATMTTFRREFAASAGPTGLARNLQSAHDTWLVYVNQQLDRVAAGQRDQAVAEEDTGRGKTLFDAIRARNDTVASWLDGARTQTRRQMETQQQRVAVLLAVSLAVLVMVVIGGCLLLWRQVTRPLARLTAATRAVTDGALHADLPASGAVEVRSLATDVRAMRDRLTADLHAARRSREALEQAQPTVAALRAALHPLDETIPGVTLAARLDPAEGVLAGDWYDAIALAPSRLALVIGDVAGHGPASAVLALRLKHSLLAALRAGLDPGRALTQVSAELAELPPGQFATVLIAVLDTATDTLTYANAGHPAALLLDGHALAASGPAVVPVPRHVGASYPVHMRELPSTGPLLSSIIVGRAWTTATRRFRPGDTLLAVTDGVLETRDEHGTEFGAEGLLSAVAEVGLADGDRLIAAVAAASMRFGNNKPRRDDHTLLYLRRAPSEQAEPSGTVPTPIG